MNISPYQIQNVIRAYGQRVSKRSIVKLEGEGSKYSPDVVHISSEAKRKLITQKVASDIITRVKGEEVQDPKIQAFLADKVSEELGGALDVASGGKDENGLRFRVIDPDKGEVIKELSAQDTEDLIMKVYSKIEKIADK